ncbi:MAG: FHA domain-containing protein [Planctomyces sp.]|nr:FHA domain-containing protein [Planctomyces sp.]
MLAQLIPPNGEPPITLHKAITVVGRSSKLCDLVVNHTSVSKMHCILVKTDGLLYMRDLGSTNGTRVNGQRVIRGALLPGDKLSFSGVTYKVHLGPDRPQTAVTPDGVTEMLPVIPDAGELDQGFGTPDGKATVSGKSRSDVRRLTDSDLLPPD